MDDEEYRRSVMFKLDVEERIKGDESINACVCLANNKVYDYGSAIRIDS